MAAQLTTPISTHAKLGAVAAAPAHQPNFARPPARQPSLSALRACTRACHGIHERSCTPSPPSPCPGPARIRHPCRDCPSALMLASAPYPEQPGPLRPLLNLASTLSQACVQASPVLVASSLGSCSTLPPASSSRCRREPLARDLGHRPRTSQHHQPASQLGPWSPVHSSALSPACAVPSTSATRAYSSNWPA